MLIICMLGRACGRFGDKMRVNNANVPYVSGHNQLANIKKLATPTRTFRSVSKMRDKVLCFRRPRPSTCLKVSHMCEEC